jgi:hypothetical protein
LIELLMKLKSKLMHLPFAANWFVGTAKSTRNAIDITFDFVASSFGGAANATQNSIDPPLI